jgi:hypothetical protein
MKSTLPIQKTAALLACVLAVATVTEAQTSDALLNTLVKKGILTEQEAKDIAAEVSEPKEPSRWKLNNAVKQLEFFGDARLRYEFREGQTSDGDSLTRERFRYRLRFGFKGDFLEDFYYGLRLETSPSPRSTNVTIGDEPAPFAKGSDVLHVGQIYLGWRATDWLSLEAGRLPNPLVTTHMVWDADINPEGAAQKFRRAFENWELFANLGQFLYDDVNPENPVGPGGTRSDVFLLAWQLGTKYKFTDKMSLQIAPTLYNYTGTGDYGGPFAATSIVNGRPVANVTGINDLLVFEVPVEFAFQAGNFPVRAFGDFAMNLHGADRARRAGFPMETDDNKAYLAGMGIGRANKKGGWEARAWWQHVELFALDPNLVDTDVFDSRLNLEGFAVALSYALTDNITGNVTYVRGDRINKRLPTLGLGDIALDTMKDYQLLQLDLNWRF